MTGMTRRAALATLGLTGLAGCATPKGGAGAGAPAPAQSAKPLVVTPTAEEAARTLATLRKVDDHPLYAMTYHGPAPRPDLDGAPPATTRKTFACTLFVAAGEERRPVVGRNFDWDANPALVLTAYPTDGFRSISVVDISYLGLKRPADIEDAEKRKALLRAIALPFDGMNEHGLTIGMAQVDAAKATATKDRPPIGSVGIMRLTLDRAKTVDEAVKIFHSYTPDFEEVGLHYLVADKTGASSVVEYVDGAVKVTPKSGTWQVMENFHLAGTDEATRRGHRRYGTAATRLTAAGGKLDQKASFDLLRDVAQGHTQWSSFYDIATRRLAIATNKRFGTIHDFQLALD